MYSQFFFLPPPYSYDELDSAKRKSNAWLTKRFHGLEWSAGNVRYDLSLISKALAGYKVIYTRGMQKVDFIKNSLLSKLNEESGGGGNVKVVNVPLALEMNVPRRCQRRERTSSSSRTPPKVMRNYYRERALPINDHYR
jgi:hypothetical protein